MGDMNAADIPEAHACFFRFSWKTQELSGSRTDCWWSEDSGGRLAAVATVLPVAADFGNGVRPARPVLLGDLETHDIVRVVARALVAVDVLEDVGAHFTVLAHGGVFSAAPCFMVVEDNTFVG